MIPREDGAPTRRVRRALVVLAGSLAVLLGSPAGASADPPGPTNYRSEVTGVSGADAAVTARVYGGDSFLELSVAEGTSALVPGYREGELYLRFDPDGTVFVNRRSEARYLNRARFGTAEVTVPDRADADAPPDWLRVADGGTYAWHDHRIHWMSPSVPDHVDTDAGTVQPVFRWEVPIEVADRPATIRGDLVWVPPTSPAVPLLVAALALVATVAVGSRALLGGTVAAVGLGALAATVSGLARVPGVPPGAESQPLQVVLPVLALAVAGVALLVRDRSAELGAALAGLAGTPLLVSAVLQIDALTASQLPPGLPAPAFRTVLAASLGVGAGGLVAAARAGLRALPDVGAEGPRGA